MGGSLWPLEELGGVRIGSALDEVTTRRLGLRLDDSEDDEEGCETWVDPTGDLDLVTCGGVIAMVNARASARVRDAELIGLTEADVSALLGASTKVDPLSDSWSYTSGPWDLLVGFFEGRVTWANLSNGDLFP